MPDLQTLTSDLVSPDSPLVLQDWAEYVVGQRDDGLVLIRSMHRDLRAAQRSRKSLDRRCGTWARLAVYRVER